MARTKKELEKVVDEESTTLSETSVKSAATQMTSFDKGSIEGVIYPSKLKLYCTFDGTPEIDKIKITTPDGWKLNKKSLDDAEHKVTFVFIPPEKENKNCKFTAQYNGGETKEITLPLHIVPNMLDKVIANKEKYFKGEIIKIALDYQKEIDLERDKPFLDNAPEGTTKLTGPVKDRDYICYTFSADTIGQKDFTFSCYKSKPNQVSRSVKVTVEDTPESIKYALNGVNFTAVGNTFVTLCNPEVTVNYSEKELIKSAEEQVELGILKVVK